MAKPKFSQRALAWLGSVILKLLAWTLRVRCEDQAGFMDRRRRTPLLMCLWHNRILGSVLVDYRKCGRRPLPLSVLTSASRDGGLLAAFVGRFRMGNVRGSSSKRGAAALLELTSRLAAGTDIAITPDGPRGPRYELGPGILYLAQRTQVPIVPVQVEFSNCWQLKSWDRFRIPKPFSRVTLRYLRPVEVKQEEDLESAGERLKALLGGD